MYKVFFKDRIFSLTDDTYLLNKGENTYLFEDIEQLKGLIFKFIHYRDNYCVIHKDINELWQIFKECFETREAAGGLVVKDESFLAIKRWNIWDLPKGHIEEGETPDIAAIREVEEETGINNPTIKEKMDCSFHIYIYETNLILKISHWFKMDYNGDDILVPQLEEDITEAIWMPIAEKDRFIRNTYPTLLSTIDNL
jgi:8-oxo-dGTP pyrophosphatase MutT (NUDIX family)